MYVLTRDKEHLVNLHLLKKVSVYKIEVPSHTKATLAVETTGGENIGLGIYRTVDRGKEVLSDLLQALASNEKVYIMPEN